MKDDFLHKSLLEGCFHGPGAAILEFPCSENQSPVVWFSVRTEGPGHSRPASGTGCAREPQPSPRRGPLHMLSGGRWAPSPRTLYMETRPPGRRSLTRALGKTPCPLPHLLIEPEAVSSGEYPLGIQQGASTGMVPPAVVVCEDLQADHPGPRPVSGSLASDHTCGRL